MTITPETINTYEYEGRVYDLSAMDYPQLRDLHDSLLTESREASSRYNRHGWAGGKEVYSAYMTANYQFRVAIRAEHTRRVVARKAAA